MNEEISKFEWGDGEESQIATEARDWLPKKGDRVFVATNEGCRLDPLGFTGYGEPRNPTGRWQLYASGFLSAADRLVESYMGCAHEDEFIYPILSLYRHHLELELKYVLRCCPAYYEDLEEWLTKEHGLCALWRKIAELYPRFGEWTSKDCTDGCECLITEFDEHDPNSQAGRYPQDRRGNQTLGRLEIVGLKELKLGAGKVSHYLATITEQIAEDRDSETEY